MPIVIQDKHDLPLPGNFDFGAAIVHPSRVREIHLQKINRSQLGRLVWAMQAKFPALIYLSLYYLPSDRRGYPALTRRFLGGSVQHLQTLRLRSIAFPPKLLLSTTGLVCLSLWNIPHSGYISAKALVSGLAVTLNLKSLTFGFEFRLYHHDLKRLGSPQPTRTVLPALTYFEFRGASEYFENLLARIDAPLLDTISTSFFTGYPLSDSPQLAQFMRRTTRIGALNEAHVDLRYFVVIKSLPPKPTSEKKSKLTILFCDRYWLLSSVLYLRQFLISFLPFIHMVEHLYIRFEVPQHWPSGWPEWPAGNTANRPWLEIFRLFTGVKNLYVCKEFAECNTFVWALQALVEEKVATILPALESLSLEEIQPLKPVQEIIEQFVAARRLLGHPVAVSQWNMA